MKTTIFNKLALCAAGVAIGMLGDIQAQAQPAVGVWTNRYDGTGAIWGDSVTGLAVDRSGNVIVTGNSFDTDGFSDYATIKYSGEGIPLWTRRYNGPRSRWDFATAVAVDSSGDVFVTGSSDGIGGSSDYATIKYSGDGIPLWTQRYNGPGNSDDSAVAVAVDSSGNVFVAGSSFGIGSFRDFATIKYSGAGVPLWTNRYNGPGNSNDIATATVLDSNGNVFVTGTSDGSDGFPDFVTIKYSGMGIPMWTNRYDGSVNAEDHANGMAVDGSGNVFVTGYSYGRMTLNDYDYATVAYSGDGVPLWTNRYDGPGNGPDGAASVAVDGDGNVFVTGQSWGTGSFHDYATIKYSGAGIPLWTNYYNGSQNQNDYATAVAVDGSGNVAVTGSSFARDDRPGFASADFLTISYSGDGVPLWTNRYNGPGNREDRTATVAVDSSGNVFVAGASEGSDGSYDYATIKYSRPNGPSGNAPTSAFEWAIRVASTVNMDFEAGNGLAIDSAANLYMTGWFDGTNDFGNGVWLTNSPDGGQDIYVAKYNSRGVIQWARRAGGDSALRDGGRGIGVDTAGNVYVTGEFFGTASFGTLNVTTLAHKAFFLAKYDSSGAVQWVRQSQGGNPMVGPGWSDGVYGTGLAVDGAGNSFAVGFAANVTANGTIITFGTNSLDNTLPDGASTFLVKYDNAGVARWAKSFHSLEQSYSTAVTLDGSGNVYVAGEFKVSVSIGTTNFTNAGDKDGFVAKFNSAGDFQWARQMSGLSDAAGLGVSADETGNVYVAGGFGNGAGDTISFAPSLTLTSIGGGFSGTGIGDAFLAKYDGLTGTPQWAVRAGGANADGYTGVSTDAQGNVYVGGGRGGTEVLGGFNAVVAKYDNNGTLQWTQSSIGTDGAIVFGGPLVDATGNSYVAGWFQTSAMFGANTLTGVGYWDFFLAKVGFSPLTLGIVWSNAMPWLSVSGEIGDCFMLEYVSALSASNHWQYLATDTLVSKPFIFPDMSVGESSSRFYRARLVPKSTCEAEASRNSARGRMSPSP